MLALATSHWLVASGLTQAVVSLHAVDPERYIAITGAGTPEEVIQGVRNLLNRGVRVELNVVQNHDNVDHLADVEQLVDGCGAAGFGLGADARPGEAHAFAWGRSRRV